jgi:hypothetical protein
MLRFVADENFNYNLVKELLSHQPKLDIICLPNINLSGIDDATGKGKSVTYLWLKILPE